MLLKMRKTNTQNGAGEGRLIGTGVGWEWPGQLRQNPNSFPGLVSLTRVVWICIKDFIDADLSSPIGMAGTQGVNIP